MKPVLYIDVDDTIIAEIFDGSGFDLRPNIMTQLRVLSRLFNCRWLTYWSHKDINTLLRSLYGQSFMKNMIHTPWQQDGDKADAVLKGPTDFWWLENPLTSEEHEKLFVSGNLDRYIEVQPYGPNGFANACLILFEKAGITSEKIRQVQGRLDWFQPCSQ